MSAIHAHGLTKRFAAHLAVDHVDLVVDHAEVVGLLGPNGAGKTTTIMMLLGITTPDEGAVSILGHRLPDERSAAIARTNFWASYLGLPSKLTVAEILEIHADLYAASHDRIPEIVERFGIGHLLRKFPSEMSSGQKTLVGLARCLVNAPRLLVLDEPTASLDPDIAERLRVILTGLQREEGFAMLVTSHNMIDIERLCPRVVFIGSGRVVADGPPNELAARYGAADLEGTFRAIAAEHAREVTRT